MFFTLTTYVLIAIAAQIYRNNFKFANTSPAMQLIQRLLSAS